MDKRNLKILYFSNEESEIKNLNLGFKKLVFSFFLVIFLIVSLTSIFSILFIKFYNNYKISGLKRQNNILVSQLSSMENQFADINNQMEQVHRLDNALRVLADLPKLDEGIRNVGTGGSRDFVDFVLEELPVKLKNDTKSLNIGLKQLEKKIDFQLASFFEIENKIQENKTKIQHTPSIRPVINGYIKHGGYFGKRMDPFLDEIRSHYGIDISAEKGTPVYAPAAGVVTKVTYNNSKIGFGLRIEINHGYGISTLYAHLSKIDVNKGDKIKRWEKIGEVGRSGRSTGNHLHYEVAINGKAIDPLNFILEW